MKLGFGGLSEAQGQDGHLDVQRHGLPEVLRQGHHLRPGQPASTAENSRTPLVAEHSLEVYAIIRWCYRLLREGIQPGTVWGHNRASYDGLRWLPF